MLLEVFQGLHGGHFDFYKLVGNFGIYFVKGFHRNKIKKSKKSNHLSKPFFIKDGQVIADFGIGGLQSL